MQLILISSNLLLLILLVVASFVWTEPVRTWTNTPSANNNKLRILTIRLIWRRSNPSQPNWWTILTQLSSTIVRGICLKKNVRWKFRGKIRFCFRKFRVLWAKKEHTLSQKPRISGLKSTKVSTNSTENVKWRTSRSKTNVLWPDYSIRSRHSIYKNSIRNGRTTKTSSKGCLIKIST